MHHFPLPAARLIEDMKAFSEIATRATNASVRRAAERCRDKAFAEYVWGA